MQEHRERRQGHCERRRQWWPQETHRHWCHLECGNFSQKVEFDVRTARTGTKSTRTRSCHLQTGTLAHSYPDHCVPSGPRTFWSRCVPEAPCLGMQRPSTGLSGHGPVRLRPGLPGPRCPPPSGHPASCHGTAVCTQAALHGCCALLPCWGGDVAAGRGCSLLAQHLPGHDVHGTGYQALSPRCTELDPESSSPVLSEFRGRKLAVLRKDHGQIHVSTPGEWPVLPWAPLPGLGMDC